MPFGGGGDIIMIDNLDMTVSTNNQFVHPNINYGPISSNSKSLPSLFCPIISRIKPLFSFTAKNRSTLPVSIAVQSHFLGTAAQVSKFKKTL
jgi:hypothetical protein